MRLRRILSAMGILQSSPVGEFASRHYLLAVWFSLPAGPFSHKIDRLLHGGRLERHRYFSSFAGGGISSVKSVHHDQTIFSSDLRSFFSAGAAGEVGQFLRRAVVPELFENRDRSSLWWWGPFRRRSRSRFRCKWAGHCPCAGWRRLRRPRRRPRCDRPCRRGAPSYSQSTPSRRLRTRECIANRLRLWSCRRERMCPSGNRSI